MRERPRGTKRIASANRELCSDLRAKRRRQPVIYELPDLDHFLRPAAVPVIIAIPLAFRRAAACAVEATNGPAVQSLTWAPPHHRPIFCWEKIEIEPRLILKFWEN
jgi:hypothetical protein